jgi:hypothetical protein
VIINLGTNDNNTYNNVTSESYHSGYIKLINDVHKVWPQSQIIMISLWNGFGQVGNTWAQGGAFIEVIEEVYEQFRPAGYVQ